MSSSGSNETSEAGGDSVEDFVTPSATAAISAAHLVSLMALGAFGRQIYRRVEIRHPVYALLFQNVAVLSLFELVQFLFFLAACAWRFPFRLVRLEHVAFVAEFQFHEVTWLCVSYLRYHFIVRLGPEDEPDLDVLRRRSLVVTWLLYAIQVGLPFLAWTNVAKLFGWPRVLAIDMSAWQRLAIFAAVTVAANLPDLASIGLYLLVRRHVLRGQEERGEGAEEGGGRRREAEEVPPYGGIYTGSVERTDSREDDGGEEEGAETTGRRNLNAEQEVNKEVRCVMAALRTYALVCLLDGIFLLLMSALPKNVERLILNSLFRQLLSVWTSLVSTAMNFGPVRSVVKSCLLGLFGKDAVAINNNLNDSGNQVHPQQ